MDQFVNEFTKQCQGVVAEFKNTLLLSLLPKGMDDITEAAEFLKRNHVQFVEYPDLRQELHGFGRKLGDVFYGIENDGNGGLRFVTRFTPTMSNKEGENNER